MPDSPSAPTCCRSTSRSRSTRSSKSPDPNCRRSRPSAEGAVLSIDDIILAFGFALADLRQRPLGTGLSGDPTVAVETPEGTFFVKRWRSESAEYAARVAALQERVRTAGAPMPAHRRALSGEFVACGGTVQELAPGQPPDSRSPEQARIFGTALGRLDAALSGLPIDPFFADLKSVFFRAKEIDHVEQIYLEACDGRFPAGYRRHLKRTLGRLRAELGALGAIERVMTHVDANPENALFDNGRVTLIDLTPEIRHPGYSLGAALYWWAFPWQTNVLDLEILDAVTAGYLSAAPLPPRLRAAVSAHMLNRSLMELAFPLGCLVDGPPLGAKPMVDLPGRLRRAEILYERLDDIRAALSSPD